MEEKLLLIAPVFGEYHKVINNTLRCSSKYSKVCFIPEAPLYNLGIFATVSKIIPFFKTLLIRLHNRVIFYTAKIIGADTLFIIRGEFVDSHMLKQLRRGLPNLKIITYQWDSIKNNPNAEKLLAVSDKAYSFDVVDTLNYPMKYLPLFYCWKECGFESIKKKTSVKPVDFFFVGGYRTSRVEILRTFKEYCEKNGFTYYIKSFERFGSYVKNRKKLNMDINDISFRQLSYKDYYFHLLASRFVIDIQSPTQTGMTMRTSEALSLQKKLITTNQFIKQTSLYTDDMVYVLRDKSDIETVEFKHFLEKENHKVNDVLSLTEWLKQVGVL